VPGGRGHLLAAEHQQPGALDLSPAQLRGDGVVVGGHDEVEGGQGGAGAHLGGGLLAVGVIGVQVEVAPIPSGGAVHL
jgi:hypothetical protein